MQKIEFSLGQIIVRTSGQTIRIVNPFAEMHFTWLSVYYYYVPNFDISDFFKDINLCFMSKIEAVKAKIAQKVQSRKILRTETMAEIMTGDFEIL
jgi:hypothetical protein